MVNIAACATRGVNLPSRKQTRNEIIRMFKEQMKALKERLNVSSLSFLLPSLLLHHFRARLSVARLVSLVTHGRRRMLMRILLLLVIGLRRKHLMSGSNTRHYLALHRWTVLITAFDWGRHYTRSAIGLELFTRYVWIVLVKICSIFPCRLAISHVIMPRTTTPCWMNSHTAIAWRLGKKLMFLGAIFSEKFHPYFLPSCWQSWEHRCLAHIINLATQALIATWSKAKYYSADTEDAHMPDTAGAERDELGLVRAICVKVISHFPIICTDWQQIRLGHPRNARSCLRNSKNARTKHCCNSCLTWKSVGVRHMLC